MVFKASSQCRVSESQDSQETRAPTGSRTNTNTQDALRPSGPNTQEDDGESSRRARRNICGTALQRPAANATTASP